MTDADPLLNATSLESWLEDDGERPLDRVELRCQGVDADGRPCTRSKTVRMATLSTRTRVLCAKHAPPATKPLRPSSPATGAPSTVFCAVVCMTAIISASAIAIGVVYRVWWAILIGSLLSAGACLATCVALGWWLLSSALTAAFLAPRGLSELLSRSARRQSSSVVTVTDNLSAIGA
ncbi:hypothetical protein P43SY_005893 [Pythium insidiosum]|uniref:Transmembrane protein n=1 Tax=Pythium insidiosum TaxID=114742 RepID=A0AAD5L8Q3_PYTIN|nr:hypothetical protein P43SY_005893 [Pythium insidiosum]